MPSRWITLLALSIASLVGGLAPTTSQAQKLEAAYVILGAQAPVARVVITGATQCPTITIDNTPQPMSIRAEADADFPVLVCEARVPNRAASASVEGQALPLPNGTPDAIVAFGDTGCRLKGIDTFLGGVPTTGRTQANSRTATTHRDGPLRNSARPLWGRSPPW